MLSKFQAYKTDTNAKCLQRSDFHTQEHGDKHNEKRIEKDIECNKNIQQEDDEQEDDEHIITEGFLDIDEERRIKRNEKRRQKYNEKKLQSSGMQAELRVERNTEQQQTHEKKMQAETIEQRDQRNTERRQTYRKRIESETDDQKELWNKDRRKRHQNVEPAEIEERNKKRRQNGQNALSDEILDIGVAVKICCHCGAVMWRYEQTEQQQRLKSDMFSLCCGNGKVLLPLLRETPPELKSLLDGTHDKSALFHKSSRLYNTAFGFTSWGAQWDKKINDGRGPFVYRVHGVIYHNMGSLFPEESKKPVFSQIYMHDNQQLEERLNFPNGNDKLDIEITNSLSVMLNRENALIDIYRQVRERFRESDVIPIHIRFVANRLTDGR
ncbi:hypothetical protein AgCh_020890 [Apium graveolens]